jgi:hypothetical protein
MAKDRFNRVALAALLVALPLAIASGPAAASAPPLVRVGATPRVPAGARSLGAISSSASLSGTVVLKPRDNAALVQFISDVSNPSSPLFHQYLPAGAFASRFGPTEDTINAVRSQLTADGLRVTGVSSDGLLVDFSGRADQIERAFQTGVERYRLANGTTGQTATSAAALPSKIAGSVTGVIGLNDLARAQPAGIVRAPASERGKFRRAATAGFSHPSGAPDACPAATADAQANDGLTDDQIAHAYGAFGLYDSGDLGQGEHIALYELEPFLYSDVRTFDTCYFGAAQAASMIGRLSVIPIEGGQPTGPGSGEANLDVEDLSAMAPDATIDVYEGPSPGADGVIYDPVDEYAAIVNADRDQVISTSWGLCEQAIQSGQPGLQQAENLLFEQAAAQGQSVFAAAGDNGSDDCDTFETTTVAPGQNPVSVDDPGSQPYVVSVGGTTITDASEPPIEHVWNDGGIGGAGGGGISESWTMPAWQRASDVPGIPLPGSADYTSANAVERASGYPTNFCQSNVPGAGSSTPCRVVPDVSSQGDEGTGAITVYYDGSWQTVGGTSSSTPIWAAMLAVTNASQTCASQSATSTGVGFVSPLLYTVASNPAQYAASFTDVTAGNNDIYDLGGGNVFAAGTGYDLASGLGSPQLTAPNGGPGLAYYLCSFAAKATRPAVTDLSPDYGSTAGGERVTITGFGFESGGVPDVSGVQVGNAGLASGRFTVNGPTSITATLPAARRTLAPDAPAPQDGAGPADIIVTTTGGESSAPGPSSTFEYVDTSATNTVPSITAVIPFGGSELAPRPATILGSGFSDATTVTFGGVPAHSFTVDGPNRITATPPPFSSRTACAPLPSTGVYAGENAENDICQVQVRVINPHGTSTAGHILPPIEGTIEENSLGVLVAPPGCGCETQLAPTEYDYLPQPQVTSVSTSAGPASWLSENPNKPSVLTVHGAGFAPMDIDWADFGNPLAESSMDVDYVYLTGTEMQIVAPGETATANPLSVPFSIKTLAGESNEISVTYAPTPPS